MRLIFLFLVLCQSVQALQTISKISDKEFPTIYHETSAVLNGRLFFLDNNQQLWITNGFASSTQLLQLKQQAVQVAAKALFQVGDFIVFINAADKMLWRTDGSSFQVLSSQQVYEAGGSNQIRKIGDFVVVRAVNDNSLILTDGNTTSQLSLGDVSVANFDSLCVFDKLHVAVVLDGQNIYDIQENSVSEITTTLFGGVGEAYFFRLKLTQGNRCFYQYEKNEGELRITNFFIYSDNKKLNIIQGADANVVGWQDMALLDDEVILLPRVLDVTQGKNLYRLAANSVSAQKIDAIELSSFEVAEMGATKNNLYVHLTPIVDFGAPVPFMLRVYDDNLESYLDYGGSFPAVIARSSGDVMWFDSSVDELVFLSGATVTTPSKQLRMPQANISSVVGDDDAIYIFADDRNSSLASGKALYKISNTMTVSSQLNGLWYDNQWQYQGLSLHTGIREDNSVYLFISFYIFKDGEPFWLAGSADLDLGQGSIQIHLDEFKGESFLPNSTGTNPELIPYGKLTLSPTGCNSMNALLEVTDEEPVSLVLRRIGDKTYKNICFD